MPLGASERCPFHGRSEASSRAEPDRAPESRAATSEAGTTLTEVLNVAATLPELSVVISELHDGEASFLVSLPSDTQPALDQAVLDIKRCDLNRSQIGGAQVDDA